MKGCEGEHIYIYCINKELKVKQILRSFSPNNGHFIQQFQTTIIGKLNFFLSTKTNSLFFNNSIEYLNELGQLALEEVSSQKGLKINRAYNDIVSSVNLADFLMYAKNKMISIHYAQILKKIFGIVNVKQFTNDFKFSRSDKHIVMLKFIFETEGALFKIIIY